MSELKLDPRTYARALDCVHCGLCLPACPTYAQNGNEADSPRGRIQLMRGLSDGAIDPTAAVVKHLDLCLDCRACETACPSGVVYHELIEETRERLAATRTWSLRNRILRWLFLNIVTRAARFRLVVLPAKLLRKIGGSLWPTLPSDESGSGIGYFAGCVGSVLCDDLNRKAIDLLKMAGSNVSTPRAQGCCGAIHHHNGEDAKEFARRNIDAFASADRVVTPIAGCGAMLKEYDHLLRDDSYAQRAKEFVAKVRDINELLVELGLPKSSHAIDETITYHDACHLAHAQKITAQPRQILSSIPGLKLIPLVESDMCCGAAGTYNLTEPEMAADLANRKIDHIVETGAKIVVTGNIGCAMQIRAAAAKRGLKIEVVHPVELLHKAVFQSIEQVDHTIALER